jgi:N-acetyl-beta-hexosaminidase
MESARLLVALMYLSCLTASAIDTCPIVPKPRVYKPTGAVLELPKTARIVIGKRATDPERYAAEYFGKQLLRRFGRRSVVTEEQAAPGSGLVLVFGQRSTCALLDRLCRENGLDLSPKSPGFDGFVISSVADGGRKAVLVGGSNPRGVVYGQHALFDLLRERNGEVVLPEVHVADAPDIAWRGRPHSVLDHHLQPGALDAYLRARLNFTDVRDDPDVRPGVVFAARKASMGLPAGRPLDVEKIRRHITESHRRGLFVYGTVSCAVDENGIDQAIKTFRELIDLGVDGLWISFDDTGYGKSAEKVVRRTLALGKQHGIEGRKIAITPPLKEYQNIDMPWNRKAATEWGLSGIQWFFTRPPRAQDVVDARKVGITTLPGWWHNLEGMRGGFLHNGGVLCTLRADGLPAYVNPQPISRGWHRPTYDSLRDAAKHSQCVMLWCVCNGWPEEYQLGDLGLWAWRPAGYDRDKTLGAIYGSLYGQALVETAGQFDRKLSDLKDLYVLPPWFFWQQKMPGWPPRLRDSDSRDKASTLIAELEGLAGILNKEAPKQTSIDPARLERVYLEPMRKTLTVAKTVTKLDFPDYGARAFEQRIAKLTADGNKAEADKAFAQRSREVEEQLATIARELGDMKRMDYYFGVWRRRSVDVKSLVAHLNRQQRENDEAFAKVFGGGPKVLFPYLENANEAHWDGLFTALSKPPEGGKPLARFAPEAWLKQPAERRGAFCYGPFRWQDHHMAGITYPRGRPSKIGDGLTLHAAIGVPTFENNLLLDLFVNDTRLESRYPGYRFMTLKVGGETLWDADIAPSREGQEWITVDVTRFARKGGELKLSFTVADRRRTGDHLTFTAIGPGQLRDVKIEVPLPIIPKPTSIEKREGSFLLMPKTRIMVAEATRSPGKILAGTLAEKLGFPLKLADATAEREPNGIVLRLDPSLERLGPEGYTLTVSPERVVIAGMARTGVFYGTQTLRQLLLGTLGGKSEVALPCLLIEDSPRFPWRGVMLDSARHFQGPDFVKRFIDLLAYHKMNRLHWHFIDDQGFRFDSEAYPKLRERAAWRPNLAARLNYLPNDRKERYGGFYTKAELKEIVAYAEARGVVIVPEFEMPGHALASIMAYPELSCTGKPKPVGNAWIYPDVYCPGKDSTFQFIEAVLDEIMEVFPSPWIHIGGDECPKRRWRACPNCQKRIKDEGFKNEAELQSYFVKRVESFLNSKGRRLIGWDEILEGGLPPRAMVQSWRGMGAGVKSANEGHDVVMSPTSHCYLDYSYTKTPTAKTYAFEPVPGTIAPDKRAHILGVECCMWLGNVSTRYLQAHGKVMPISHIEHHVFPRAIALGEVGWSPRRSRNWGDFQKRLDQHKAGLKTMGVNHGP